MSEELAAARAFSKQYRDEIATPVKQVSSTGVAQGQTGDAAHVRPVSGLGTATNNRRLLAVATTYSASTNKVSWLAEDNIREVTIFVEPTDAALGSNARGALVVIDAPNDAAAGNWLDQTIDSETAEVLFEAIPVGIPVTYQFTTNILRLDFEAIGFACNIWIGAY